MLTDSNRGNLRTHTASPRVPSIGNAYGHGRLKDYALNYENTRKNASKNLVQTFQSDW